MPMLRDGLWLSTGADGQTDFVEFHNSISNVSITCAEFNIGVSGNFEYDSTTGIYSVHAGCTLHTETWTLTKNDGATAEMTKEDGSVRTLFFLGSGRQRTLFSLNELRSMAQNYFESRNGADKAVRYTAVMRANSSGLADIRVIEEFAGRAYTVETYTIDVRTGGWDTKENVIDFTFFA